MAEYYGSDSLRATPTWKSPRHLGPSPFGSFQFEDSQLLCKVYIVDLQHMASQPKTLQTRQPYIMPHYSDCDIRIQEEGYIVPKRILLGDRPPTDS